MTLRIQLDKLTLMHPEQNGEQKKSTEIKKNYKSIHNCERCLEVIPKIDNLIFNIYLDNLKKLCLNIYMRDV